MGMNIVCGIDLARRGGGYDRDYAGGGVGGESARGIVALLESGSTHNRKEPSTMGEE